MLGFLPNSAWNLNYNKFVVRFNLNLYLALFDPWPKEILNRTRSMTKNESCVTF